MTDPTPEEIAASLNRWPITGQLWIAYSGGRDSHVLLHALSTAGVPVRAIHVDHGLHPESRRWVAHCEAVCRALGVALTVRRVQVEPAGAGIEAAARDARYAALGACLASGDRLATAHHGDDQAETVLLHLLRGSGTAGLAGMPVDRPLGCGLLIRPLLTWPRQRLTAYARRNGLRWIEDPANADPRFDRSFLRQQVVPLLGARWPVADAIRRSTTHLLAEVRVLRRLLDEELASGGAGATLPIAVLQRRDDPAHRGMLLRAWLQRRQVRPPPEARLRAGLPSLMTARADRAPVLRWSDGQIRRYRDRLYLLAPVLPTPPPQASAWDPARAWRAAGIGVLSASQVTGRGVALSLSRGAGLTVDFRRGGERIRPAGTAHRRALKTLLQEWGVPPWERDRLPLIYAGDQLVAVADRTVAAEALAGAGEPGLLLRWQREGDQEMPPE